MDENPAEPHRLLTPEYAYLTDLRNRRADGDWKALRRAKARLFPDAGKPKTRASVVAEMEAAIAASYPLVKSKPRPQLLGWLEHQRKMVTAYRVNGVVSPVSRPKN